MKGHTFTLLDQSFGTLIKTLKRYALYTVSRMMYVIGCIRSVVFSIQPSAEVRLATCVKDDN
eukprot:5950929-Pleurochrysis_carterae.AAC.1